MSNPTPILASLLDATLPDYAALVAENARLREELSTVEHRARQRVEEAVGHYIGALRTANATIALLECVNEQLRGCAVPETDTETAEQDKAFLDGLVTEKYSLQRQLRAEKAASVSIRNELAALRSENADLRRNLRAAEGRAERIDNQALLLQDQVTELREAGQKALNRLTGMAQCWHCEASEREPCDSDCPAEIIRRALAATAPEEGA